MPYSTRSASRGPKRVYNKWRLATLTLNITGLVLFLFAEGIGDLQKPLMVASVAILWAGAAVSYTFLQREMGKRFELVARMSYFISMVLALVLTVLAVLTLLR